MKYVLMYTSRPDLDALVPEERQQEVYQEIFGWFEKHGAAFVDGGAELQPPDTASTVRAADDGDLVVVDGPFSEAKEGIGGFSIVEVDDLDAALELAKSWPLLSLPGNAVEVRPIVDHSGM